VISGRDGELAAALASAAAVRAGTGRLVEVTGAAGYGKSTLVGEVTRRLDREGFTVWRHTATLPERALSWAGLAALLEEVDPQVIAALPAGPRAHIESITAPEPATAVQPHGVAIAVRDMLESAASAGPLAIVLDDENWLDPPSAGVITFATRSVSASRILLILSRRSEELSSIDVSAIPEERRDAIVVSGLPIETIVEIVAPIAGRALSRSALRAVHQRSAGNPMLAAEIARQVAAGESLERALTPRSIVESLRPRLAALTPTTRTAIEIGRAHV